MRKKRGQEIYFVPIQEDLTADAQLLRLIKLAKFIIGERETRGLPEEQMRLIAFAAED